MQTHELVARMNDAGPTQDITLPLTESGAEVVIRFAPPARQACVRRRELFWSTTCASSELWQSQPYRG